MADNSVECSTGFSNIPTDGLYAATQTSTLVLLAIRHYQDYVESVCTLISTYF